MTEPRIPEVRDDDPEDVADKLSIASAMWGRGDRADALTWLRRAAESASDADADMRALELAKAASELGNHVSAPAAPAPAPAPAPKPPAPAPSRPQTAAPPAPPAPPANKPPTPQTVKPKPPASRPPGGKLPPLPPIRPLGSAPAAPPKPATVAPAAPAAPPAAPATPQRLPSMVTSALGTTMSSGTVTREPPKEQAPKPMPWDEPMAGDDEPTRQIAISPAEEPFDGETTRTRELEPIADESPSHLDETRPGDSMAESGHPPAPAASVSSIPIETPSLREGPPTVQAQELPLAVGVRVRLVIDGDRVIAEPDQGQAGVLALLVPASADDDLRTVFQR